MDKSYFNIDGIILAVSNMIIAILIWDDRVYRYLVISPTDIATKTTTGIFFKTALYSLDKYVGKWSIFSFFVGLAVLGIVSGFDWRRFFDKNN